MPLCQMFFDKVIFMWDVVFCILSFPHQDESQCDDGSVSFFCSHIMMQLRCWECSAVPLGQVMF